MVPGMGEHAGRSATAISDPEPVLLSPMVRPQNRVHVHWKKEGLSFVPDRPNEYRKKNGKTTNDHDDRARARILVFNMEAFCGDVVSCYHGDMRDARLRGPRWKAIQLLLVLQQLLLVLMLLMLLRS